MKKHLLITLMKLKPKNPIIVTNKGSYSKNNLDLILNEHYSSIFPLKKNN